MVTGRIHLGDVVVRKGKSGTDGPRRSFGGARWIHPFGLLVGGSIGIKY